MIDNRTITFTLTAAPTHRIYDQSSIVKQQTFSIVGRCSRQQRLARQLLHGGLDDALRVV
jgi:hypothetical protein